MGGPRKAASRVSAEIFSIPLGDGGYLVYGPLQQAAFVGNAAAVNAIAGLMEGGDAECPPHLLELLRALHLVDGSPETAPITTFHGAPRPTELTLFLTTSCNLRCTYCYASAGDTPAKHMPMEVARRGIDTVVANAVELGVEEVRIAWHGGGEPSVNWRTLTGSREYAAGQTGAHGVGLHCTLATNGALRDDRIDWIVEHVDEASLSFDGLPEVHDRHRPTAAGRGSSGRVMHTMERFDAAAFPYGLRMTVTADQIAQLSESVAFICERFSPFAILVEPAYQLGRWKEAASAETVAFIAAYREAKAAARRHGRDIEFSGARLGLLTNHFCGVTQDAFALTPDGNVSACYEAFSEDQPLADRFFYGRADGDGFAFDMDVLSDLRGQAVQHREHCNGCFAKWSCGGDCHHRALHVAPGEKFAGTDRCHIIRELTKDQILDRVRDGGGLVWSEGGNP